MVLVLPSSSLCMDVCMYGWRYTYGCMDGRVYGCIHILLVLHSSCLCLCRGIHVDIRMGCMNITGWDAWDGMYKYNGMGCIHEHIIFDWV